MISTCQVAPALAPRSDHNGMGSEHADASTADQLEDPPCRSAAMRLKNSQL